MALSLPNSSTVNLESLEESSDCPTSPGKSSNLSSSPNKSPNRRNTLGSRAIARFRRIVSVASFEDIERLASPSGKLSFLSCHHRSISC